MLADGKVARLVYPAFQSNDAEKKAIDEAFQTILTSGAQELIIDIRGNGGGRSEMGDRIFGYLRQNVDQGTTRARVSRELFADWSKEMNLPPGTEAMVAPLMGTIVSSEDPIAKAFESMQPKPPARAQRFSGRLWLLVDNGTFSAACMFTGAFRDYSMGKIIGYETGEPAIGYGNFLQFSLKNSNIPYVVSSIQFFPPKPRPGDEEHGIVPDIVVNEKLLAPFAKESDPMLAFALSRIRESAH
jgi:C-terminal processing protease CtpA/Prc